MVVLARSFFSTNLGRPKLQRGCVPPTTPEHFGVLAIYLNCLQLQITLSRFQEQARACEHR